MLVDADELRRLFEAAGATKVSIDTPHCTTRFPCVRSMVEADVRGWLPVVGVVLDDDLIERILTEAEAALSEYVTPDGQMMFDAPAHIVTAQA